MSIITLSDIGLSYGASDVLKSVSFMLNAGDKLGIIGVNGAGKSSLLKIISGDIDSSHGSVTMQKNLKIGFLKQSIDEESDKTVYEYIFSSLKEEYKTKASGVLKKLSFPEETHNMSISKLSGGQKTRLSLAAVLLSDNDIILLDEPTNHLDITSLQWLEGVIRASKKTFLIVSHDRYFLDKTTTHTLEIENGVSEMYVGSYSVFREKKDKLREDQMKHYLIQQKEIKRLEAFIENQRRWNREKNIIAAESRQKAIDRMVKIERPSDAPKSIHFSLQNNEKSGNDVLTVRELSKTFTRDPLFTGLSFDVKRNDRLFILGDNGSGKSTLLKIITDKTMSDKGSFTYGYNVKSGYFDQEQQLLNEENTVIDELWDSYETFTQTRIRTALASFGFMGDDVFKQVSVLSGGERVRLSICKLIMTGVNLLILDEPTNHLDINSKEMLENALKEYDGTLICVSHDRYFIKALSTRILDIGKSRYDNGYHYYNCDYDYYLTKKEALETVNVQSSQKSERANDYDRQKKQRSERLKKERRISKLETMISEHEEKIEQINEDIRGKYSSDYAELQRLYAELETLSSELDSYMEEYFELTEAFEEETE